MPGDEQQNADANLTRCLVPGSRDATLTREGEEALWQQFFTAQPEQRREFEPSSKRRKKRPAADLYQPPLALTFPVIASRPCGVAIQGRQHDCRPGSPRRHAPRDDEKRSRERAAGITATRQRLDAAAPRGEVQRQLRLETFGSRAELEADAWFASPGSRDDELDAACHRCRAGERCVAHAGHRLMPLAFQRSVPCCQG